MVFLIDKQLEEHDSGLCLCGLLEGVEHLGGVSREAFGVLSTLLLEVIFDFGGEIDADVALI